MSGSHGALLTLLTLLVLGVAMVVGVAKVDPASSAHLDTLMLFINFLLGTFQLSQETSHSTQTNGNELALSWRDLAIV